MRQKREYEFESKVGGAGFLVQIFGYLVLTSFLSFPIALLIGKAVGYLDVQILLIAIAVSAVLLLILFAVFSQLAVLLSLAVGFGSFYLMGTFMTSEVIPVIISFVLGTVSLVLLVSLLGGSKFITNK